MVQSAGDEVEKKGDEQALLSRERPAGSGNNIVPSALLSQVQLETVVYIGTF